MFRTIVVIACVLLLILIVCIEHCWNRIGISTLWCFGADEARWRNCGFCWLVVVCYCSVIMFIKMFNFYNIYSFCVVAYFFVNQSRIHQKYVFFSFCRRWRSIFVVIFFLFCKGRFTSFFCCFTFTLHITHTRSLGWRQMGEYWGLGDDFCVCVNRQV